MLDYVMTRPLPLALIGAHFAPYALVAFAAIVIRILKGRFRRAEILLLIAFSAFVLLEYVQLAVTGRTFASAESVTWGVNRYFGVLSPFLWIFTAKLAADVWWHAGAGIRLGGRVVICLCLAWVLVQANIRGIWSYRTENTAYDAEVAAARIASVILDDYAGLERQPVIRREPREYYTGRRPLVACPYGAAGWKIRGDSCGATEAPCPYKEDYLFFPLGSRFYGITNIDVRVYKFIGHVSGGLGAKWMLFRRRLTPGRK